MKDKRERKSYDELIAINPAIERVLSRKVYDHINEANERTFDLFTKQWVGNTKKNFKRNFKKGWLLFDSCRHFAYNKAVICIGAGPSIEKNKKLIKELCILNASFPFEQQPFFFISSNHQFKPCLEYGIIPHAVMWVDASDVVYDQLCKDIPDIAKNIMLIASTHCHPKIITEWINQGRSVRYLLSQDPVEQELYEKYSGEKAGHKGVFMGGNVINSAYMATLHCMSGRIFMTTGNDLSFDIDDDIDKRRKTYYADGDYSTNLGTTRDEAGHQFKWMGMEFIGTAFHKVTPQIVLKPKATVPTLYVYKQWIESQIALQDAASTATFHYYNCTEGGIVGVMCNSDDTTNLEDNNNWFLMDEVVPRRWHTRTLKDATSEFLEARSQLWQSRDQARGARVLSSVRSPGVLHSP